MKQHIFLISSLVLLFLLPNELMAAELPLTLEADDWRLTVRTADTDSDRLCQPSDIDMYELKLENTSGNKKDVSMHTFRQEEGKDRDEGLVEDAADVLAANASLGARNLPISQDVEALDVLILWQEEDDAQYFKQQFMVPLQAAD
ncbi:hypothetical protein HUG15_06645 [Salicibibacter cibarius]|uniref:DUF4352 domain-containing protein n=1 Tax=Salicibibacter cibarius TaxID=2743000 RepID=A0A7T6Z1K2_9BACI|nr:hypothetical protein [Salicibibacter cibarius]QQK75300.1 hypothetical protein HUG15_06645 [Salicibibacter cibarius]